MNKAPEPDYRAMFDYAMEGMYQSSSDGRLIRVNASMARILGYDSPTLCLEAVKDISEDVYLRPETRARLLALLESDGHVEHLESEIKRKDGKIIWISENSHFVLDADGKKTYLEGTFIDISEVKLAQETLRLSEERYRSLVENSQDGVFVANEGRYTYVNQAYADMLGYTAAEMCGTPFLHFIAPEDRPAMEEIWARRRAGQWEKYAYEISLLKKDGKTRIVASVRSGPVTLAGQLSSTGTIRDITKQKRIETELYYNATHDPLTNLANRTLFVKQLVQAMRQSRLDSAPGYAVLLVDLDAFKIVNDSLGHAAGDELLIEVAGRLRGCMGAWDTIARHGGDEFTILAGKVESAQEAIEVAERVLAALKPSIRILDQDIYTNASIGIVLGEREYDSTDAILRDVDTAMYRAKAAGKANYVIFDQEMYTKARVRMQVEGELRQALENHEFRVYYQPIVTIASRQLVGFEALLRWQHPSRGLLGPASFLHIAEETGLILPIGTWVLKQSLKDMHSWDQRDSQARDLTIAVNLAERQFSHQELPQQIKHALDETGFDPERLHLEMTETIFLENPRSADQMLRNLKELGVSLYLDDFGTGYSSLSYLSALPLDALKIDRMFVTDVHINTRHMSIMRTILELARDLGIATVAEGVEKVEQLRMLRKLGCKQAQGYYFSKPVDAEAAERLIQRRVLEGESKAKNGK
jgi:diguanylate cyclase (GGDEF)-like protein/PAS domain S-box-containing protein